MATGTERRPARAGTGSCTKCTCSRFEGHGSICENCKHHYDEHNVAWPRGLDLIWSLESLDHLPSDSVPAGLGWDQDGAPILVAGIKTKVGCGWESSPRT
jgi:hypothetical protein